LLVVGCSDDIGVVEHSYHPRAVTQAAFEKYDADQNDQLSVQELAEAPGLKAALPTADADANGSLSRDELQSRVSAYAQNNQVYPLRVTITKRGVPLSGVEVSLMPEPCFGALPSAQGTTDEQGICAPTASGLPLPAVHPGMYRVVVKMPGQGGSEGTQGGVPPPSLGVEVAFDIVSLERGVVFDVASK
jgi:hypothetical protein